MIVFYSPNLWFRNCGLILLCLQLLLFVFCLPPFQTGTWLQTEPAMVAMFSLGTLNAMWLALGIAKKWLSIERPIHPLLYGLLAWTSWQFTTLPFADNPMRSWLGIPQTGEGGGWQVMLLLITCIAMPLWGVQNFRKILLSVGVFSLCVMTYLHFNPRLLCPLYDNYIENDLLTPANWPDYLPLIAGWLWIIYASTPSIRTPPRHFWMMVVFVIAMVVGENAAAKILLRPLFIGTNIVILLQLLLRKTKFKSLRISPLFLKCFYIGKFWKTLAIVGFILPLSWVIIAQQSNLYTCQRSTSAENAIAARTIFNRAAISTLSNEPLRLIAGNGWGEFNEDMFRYGMVKGIYAFKDGEFTPNSVWLNGDVFHPHNQPMTALLSLGVIGFLLFISLPILAFLPLRKPLFWWCVPVLLGMNATGLMWFTLPQVMPFQALAFAALCAGRPARTREIITLPKWLATASFILAIILAVSSWQQVRLIIYGEKLAHILGENPNQEGIVDWLAEDINRGGDRLITAIEHYSERITNRINDKTATEHDHDWYRNFLEVAHRAATSPNSGARLAKLDVELSMLPFRLIQNSLLDDLKPKIKENLQDSIINFCAKAPQREDFIAPFLLSLDGFTGGDKNKQRDILENILKVAPNHRSALWLLGTIDKNIEMKKRAVKLGVEKVYPVTEQEVSSYQ